MPSSPSLSSTLAERTGLTAEELAPAATDEREPLPSILPPAGEPAHRLREVVARALKLSAGRVDVTGSRGCAGTAIAAAIAGAGRPVVFVAADLEGARRAA